MVPTLSLVFMAITFLIGLGVPIFLCIWYRVKKKADLLPFFIGCAVMLIFALVLESIVHQIVLNGPAGPTITGNIWLYALYGGLMAGLFEETGRLVAFLTILRKKRNNDANALMYGAGHGGLEMFAIGSMTMVNNIIYSVMINTGMSHVLTDSVTGETKAQVEQVIEQLISTPSINFLLGGVERLLAIMLQIALSVLVWFAANNKKKWYLYPVAILIHFLVDGVTVVVSSLVGNALFTEGIVLVMSVCVALFSYKVYKKNAQKPVVPEVAALPEQGMIQ